MALKRRGKHYYGDSQADIPKEILRYSRVSGFVAHRYADALCKCGGKVFRLRLDDDAGAAIRRCMACGADHPIGDSEEYLDDAKLEECACPCECEDFEVTVGISLYDEGDDVRWIYVGCRCTACGLTAVYGDWKNEFTGYEQLLKRV